MKMIFGLGNPGTSYEQTRHNVGFCICDALAERHALEFAIKPKFRAAVAEQLVGTEKVILVKPQTFYNEVGESFQALMHFYKIAPNDILIIHDELALPFGTLRTRIGGSDAGNNGIKSINLHGGEQTLRLRVGIANEKRQLLGDSDFVLASFSKDEADTLTDTVVPKSLELIETFISESFVVTSTSK